MNRRTFCQFLGVLTCTGPTLAANRRFVFRIKTKSGGIIGNIVIHSDNMEAAKYKVRKRYPDCDILDAKEGEHVSASPRPLVKSTDTLWPEDP